MRFLFCCEFYYPSIGGVQEVMRHIAERLVSWGHEVTVATTALANRDFTEHNGVKIQQFGVTGNAVRGMVGELERYQDFVSNFPCDAIMIKAAQQWTFDALWPVLDKIAARKVFIPCGFSGLYEPSYQRYFEDLPPVLHKFDHLIFYAEHYRDVDFARAHGMTHFSILANGACEREFNVEVDPGFRQRHGIAKDSFLMLTVGSLTGVKGHREIAEAFARMSTGKSKTTLILNGNAPPRPNVEMTPSANGSAPRLPALSRRLGKIPTRLAAIVLRIVGLAYRSFGVLRREGWVGVRQRFAALGVQVFGRFVPRPVRQVVMPLEHWVEKARKGAGKQLLMTDFDRKELVQAYMAADLFVFASNIEYSPLVLFESAAAGTPFLTVSVGNAEEITRWTGGGVVCPAPRDERGYTRVDPVVLGNAIKALMTDPGKLEALGKSGRSNWEQKYTWFEIAKRYERILMGGTGNE
ncbi:glycosyltransferase family 4 protein [Herbaspirillum rubrisubalbicans]|uniref:Alpha-L-glycero-D-manno-heptose alpha-1,3-glucosyltransferase n=1 Tax=Herbaspirillum rubrisubalbicans TaxID=80842 RepID=A0AAD0XES2_9BURK|nr:glycosyltransferase family 4 protein [Herbaspirillum rubrisubalbicans]AYR22732.1 alpha-L-glycero-D-manno-heptose alpha-1,3-glucosyltransferase [Herbaspirillum rubrisubalbicans]